MHRQDKERLVTELTDRLRTTDTLFVADYRGLSMPEIDGLRTELLNHGARFTVVKNTLTRRAAEAAGADALLALLEGPSAIAFLESDGDPVAVAKALGNAARTTRILAVRGGVLEGRAITADDVENLAKLPATDVLRAQVVGVLAGPLTTVVGLFTAPLRDLVGVLDARIEQLRGNEEEPAAEPEAPAQPEASAEPESEGSEPETQTEESAEEGES
jgi:large subunit ribosomal protein L10